MDPNASLRLIREHSRIAAEGEDVQYHERHIRWLFEELDEWLHNGGFLPDDWKREDES